MAVHLTPNPHYLDYVRLVKQLHELIAGGQGDSDEANSLRGELDTHVEHLNKTEFQRAEGLCGDLYTLVEDQPPPETSLPKPPRARSEIEQDLKTAWGIDWDRLLELLREGASFIPLDTASSIRGRCWLELGDPETALLFFTRASELDPSNAYYALLTINTLMELGRSDEAVVIAEQCIRITSDSHLSIVN